MLKRQGRKTLATEARHRVTIQRQTSTTDGDGGFDQSWTELTQCFAAIYPIKAQQRFEYKSLDVDATHIIKIRGLIDLEELDRVIYSSRTFEILSIENIQERDFLKILTCKEIRKGYTS